MLLLQIDVLMSPPKTPDALATTMSSDSTPSTAEDDDDDDGETVLDALCGRAKDDARDAAYDAFGSVFADSEMSVNGGGRVDDDDEPDVSLGNMRAASSWVPDLMLRYPPTFSAQASWRAAQERARKDSRQNFRVARRRQTTTKILVLGSHFWR